MNQKIVFAAPSKHEDMTLNLEGNEQDYDPSEDPILSSFSCTIKCLVPFVMRLVDEWNVGYAPV